MYLSIADMTAMMIGLGGSLFMLFMLLASNVYLLKKNRFLKSRLVAWRKACQREHVEVPF